MLNFYHLITTMAQGITLHVRHAPVADLNAADLDAAAADHGVAPRLDGETDAAMRARIHSSAPVETVEIKPGMPNKVSASFWHRWLELNPSSPLLADGKISAAAVEAPDPDAAALAERRNDATVGTGTALDHQAALHGVAGRGPGETDASLRVRLLAAHADPTEPQTDGAPTEPRAAFEAEVAGASGSALDDLAVAHADPRMAGETDESVRARLLAAPHPAAPGLDSPAAFMPEPAPPHPPLDINPPDNAGPNAATGEG